MRLLLLLEISPIKRRNMKRCRSSGVEHSLGKGEVGSSNLLGSTIPNLVNYWMKITFQEVFKIQRISMKID
jgi:hypothetical protein